MSPHDNDERPDTLEPTAEVGDEGGTFGDVEREVVEQPGGGSEANETWRPSRRAPDERVGDETGEGRRSP